MQTYESESSYSSEEMEQFQIEVKQLHTQMKQLKVNTHTHTHTQAWHTLQSKLFPFFFFQLNIVALLCTIFTPKLIHNVCIYIYHVQVKLNSYSQVT